MIKLKPLFKEQKLEQTDIVLMDIIEDVIGLEQKVIDLKKRLTELIPKVKKKEGGRKIDPNFFSSGEEEGEYLTRDKKDKIESDTEFDKYDKKRKRKYV